MAMHGEMEMEMEVAPGQVQVVSVGASSAPNEGDKLREKVMEYRSDGIKTIICFSPPRRVLSFAFEVDSTPIETGRDDGIVSLVPYSETTLDWDDKKNIFNVITETEGVRYITFMVESTADLIPICMDMLRKSHKGEKIVDLSKYVDPRILSSIFGYSRKKENNNDNFGYIDLNKSLKTVIDNDKPELIDNLYGNNPVPKNEQFVDGILKSDATFNSNGMNSFQDTSNLSNGEPSSLSNGELYNKNLNGLYSFVAGSNENPLDNAGLVSTENITGNDVNYLNDMSALYQNNNSSGLPTGDME